MAEGQLIIVEPFYGGSHKQLLDTAMKDLPYVDLYTLPAKKWHWKARTSALYFSQVIKPAVDGCNARKILFVSSVLNLAELIALRRDLIGFQKIIYFHENQLVYPVKKAQERDFQYGYNQILSCLVADKIVFNSSYNMKSFLGSIPQFLHHIPDHKPDGHLTVSQLSPKCQVLPFAIGFACKSLLTDVRDCTSPLHIVWPHRWEHDKDPETFFDVLLELLDAGYEFVVSVLGEQYEDVPAIFEVAKARLGSKILHWGHQPSKDDYYRILASADVVVSTANHEFFGVAMLEAVHLGCYPIAPNKLVYPEHFPEECLYNTKAQLAKKLRYFCKYPQKTKNLKIDVEKYSWTSLKSKYFELLGINQSDGDS